MKLSVAEAVKTVEAYVMLEDECLNKPNSLEEALEKHESIMGKVYRMLHTISSPKCRKNHPKWTEELEAMHQKLIDIEFIGRSKNGRKRTKSGS